MHMKKLPGQPLEMVAVQRHISALQEQGGFPDWWGPLYEVACNRTIFLSREWLENWLDLYGSGFSGQWVHWSCNGRVVGGCLLLNRPIRIGGLFFRTVFLNTAEATRERSPLAEYNDILHVDGFESAIANDLVALLSEMEWHRLALAACCGDGIIRRVVDALPVQDLDIRQTPAPYIDFLDLPDEPFERRLTNNTRSQIQRCRRIYEETSGPVQFTAAATLEQALQYFDEMARLHNARWSLKGRAGSFSNRLAVEFHRKLIRTLWPSGAVELVCVRAGNANVGMLYNFLSLDKVYFYQSGFAYQQDNKLKPGLLTHSMAIENYRQRGLREYDFLAGDAQYKRSFSTHERTLFGGTIYRDSRSVRLLLLAKKAKAVFLNLKARLKSAISR